MKNEAAHLQSQAKDSLASFRPVNEDHAITNVVFSLWLDEFIEPEAIAAMPTGPWRETLPALTPLPTAKLNVLGQAFETPAAQAAIYRPDGGTTWALKFNGFELSVECSTYTRWDAVWAQARDYLNQAWSQIRKTQPNIQILEYRLGVNDSFITDDDTFNVEDIFSSNAPNLPSQQLGMIWHSNVGWVELVSDGRVFETVQIQSRGFRDGYAPKGPYTVTITHALRYAFELVPHADTQKMDVIVNDLHLRNKAMLRRNVRSEMLDRIGFK